jgi:hypothetical protein
MRGDNILVVHKECAGRYRGLLLHLLFIAKERALYAGFAATVDTGAHVSARTESALHDGDGLTVSWSSMDSAF